MPIHVAPAIATSYRAARTRAPLVTLLLLLAMVASAHAGPMFSGSQTFGTGTYPYSVAVADLNADGRPDLVTANFNANTVSVLMGNGDGTFKPHTDSSPVAGDADATQVAIADLNADGLPDLVIANKDDSTSIGVLRNNSH